MIKGRLLWVFGLALGVFQPLAFSEGVLAPVVNRKITLKHMAPSHVIPVLEAVIKDPEHRRIIGVQEQTLTIRAPADQMELIEKAMPVLDQPLSETNPVRIKLILRARYMGVIKEVKKARKAAESASPGSTAKDQPQFKREAPSVYQEDDAELVRKRVFLKDGISRLEADMVLKAIFLDVQGQTYGIVESGCDKFIARQGKLFLPTGQVVPGYRTRVTQDTVTLISKTKTIVIKHKERL